MKSKPLTARCCLYRLTKPDTRTTSSAEDAGGPSSGFDQATSSFQRITASAGRPGVADDLIRREVEPDGIDQLDPSVRSLDFLGVNSALEAMYRTVASKGWSGNASVWMRAGKSRRTLPIWSSGT